MTTILSVALKNHPGSLAEVLEILAKEKINVEAVEAEAMGDFAAVHLFVSDPKRGTRFLREQGYDLVEAEAIEVDLPDNPGQLAKIARRLADADVNIVSLYGTTPAKDGTARLMLRVNKSEQARKLLNIK